MIANFLEKTAFVLTIGDEGAVLVFVKGGVVRKRLFSPSVNSGAMKEFRTLLASAPKAPIHLLVDVLDQAYLRHALPPVSAMNVKSLVKRRLEKDFAADDIKSAVPLDRSEKKEWNYLFVSVRNAPPFSEWLEAVIELSNPIASVALLPIETETLLRDFRKALLSKNKTQSEWQVLVTHQRVGGFRLVVFKNQRIIFTRMAQPVGGAAPEVIAGNIEQEISNTLEYIRRLAFDESAGMDIYIIVAEEVKKALDTQKIGIKNIFTLSPHKVAQTLDLPGSAEKNDRYGDVVIAAHFAKQRKPILSLHTPSTDQLLRYFYIEKAVWAGAAAIVIGLVAASVIGGLSYYETNKILKTAEAERTKFQKQLTELKNLRKNVPVDLDEVIETVAIHQTFSGHAKLPQRVIEQLSAVTSKEPVTVTNIMIRQNQKFSQKDGFPEADGDMTFELNARLGAPSQNVEAILSASNQFMRFAKERFEPAIQIDVTDPLANRPVSVNLAGGSPTNTTIKLTGKGDTNAFLIQAAARPAISILGIAPLAPSFDREVGSKILPAPDDQSDPAPTRAAPILLPGSNPTSVIPIPLTPPAVALPPVSLPAPSIPPTNEVKP